MSKDTCRAQSALLVATCFVMLNVACLAQTGPPAGPPAGPGGEPPPAPVFKDTPAAAEHRALAKRAAGTRWQSAYDFYCGTGLHPSKFPDETVEPQWLFDNLAILGDRSTVEFILKTSDGFLMIDSGIASSVETVLLPGLAKLGIDPASIKAIVISHGHPDHFGGATYFQAHYGTKIVASDADWTLITSPPTMLPPHPEPWMVAKGPTRDAVVADGGEVVVGDLHLKAFLIPGHTPGSLGFIFPVKDAGRVHMAAIFGGAILAESRTPVPSLAQFVQSLASFADATRLAKVDVELQNHPAFDDTWVKTQELKERKPGRPNPFVVGTQGYQEFLTVISQCTQAMVAQRQ